MPKEDTTVWESSVFTQLLYVPQGVGSIRAYMLLLSNHGQELAVGFAKDYVSAELMKVEKSMVRITCYDGVRCIGGNKILLEDDDTKLWLDFGLNFGRMSMYYEEYLKPKNCLGLYEPVQMG
ncbi:MAG: hypothetical protein K6U00_12415, partial [Armatimonadetes bacterium]|nr:hypothetical protein [Armatimonadota bacterium]